MVDFVQARDQINELIHTGWMLNASAIVGYTPLLYLPRVVNTAPVDPSKHWGRVSLQSVDGGQSAHGCNGVKKYEDSGLVFVQLFAPRADIEAGEIQDNLGKMVRGLFRGKSTPGKVWFRKARLNDLEPEKEMLRLNVVAEYTYQERA